MKFKFKLKDAQDGKFKKNRLIKQGESKGTQGLGQDTKSKAGHLATSTSQLSECSHVSAPAHKLRPAEKGNHR